MPWDNFTHPGQLVSAGEDISISGPGTFVRSEVHAAPGLRAPTNLELGAGASASHPAEVAAFATRQAALVRNYRVDPEFWLPDWVRAKVDQNATPDELLAALVDRVRQDPHEGTLLEAQAIINELARTPDGAALVRRHVTADIAQEIARLGRGRSG